MTPKRVPLSALLEIDGALSAAIHDIGEDWLRDARKANLRRQLFNARVALRVRFDIPVLVSVRDDVSEVAA